MFPFKIKKILTCDECRLKYPKCCDCNGDILYIYYFNFLDSKNKCVISKVLFIK